MHIEFEHWRGSWGEHSSKQLRVGRCRKLLVRFVVESQNVQLQGKERTVMRVMQLSWDDTATQYIDLSGLMQFEIFL